MAAAGVDVNKTRILARHSGEAVYRYVAQAPLKSLSADLGLPGSTSSSINAQANHQRMTLMLGELTRKVEKQDRLIAALQATVQTPEVAVYVQNMRTLAVHMCRPGDSTHTACGWSVGPAQQCRGAIRWLASTVGEPWTNLCERCLLPQRQAARLLANAGASSDSE